MKIARNDLCPCGSGKKYKRCCYLQTNSLHTELDHKESNIVDYENSIEDDFFDAMNDFENQAFFLEAINNLRRISLDRKTHIKEYRKIRKLHSEIVNNMVLYHEADKFQLKIDDNYIKNNKHLLENMDTLHLIETNFDTDTREGAQALYDLLIYKRSSSMNCITESFIQSHRYRKPEKIEFLHSMLSSTLGLYEITKTDFDEGCVYFKEIFTDIEYKIVDIALSGSQIYDDIYIYTRLINYHDTVFNTGLNLIIKKSDSFIKNHIRNHKKNYTSEGELLRFIQLYNYYSKNPNKLKILTNTVK